MGRSRSLFPAICADRCMRRLTNRLVRVAAHEGLPKYAGGRNYNDRGREITRFVSSLGLGPLACAALLIMMVPSQATPAFQRLYAFATVIWIITTGRPWLRRAVPQCGIGALPRVA
jgi:hypothetical protein